MTITIKRRHQLLVSLASTYLFGLAAYAVCYFGMLKKNDSNEIFFGSTSVEWQIRLGRWLQPLWWHIRGSINAAWLIGLVALAIFAVAAWLITDLIDVHDNTRVALTSGILVTAKALAVAHATYINWVDVYAVCTLLVTVSAWVCLRSRRWYIGVLPLAASVAIYQAYFSFWCALVVIVVLLRVLDAKSFDLRSQVLQPGVRLAACAVASMALYWISTRVAFAVTGLEASTTYNGISSIGVFDGGVAQVAVLLAKTWVKPLTWAWKGHDPVHLVLYALIVVWALVVLVRKLKGAPRAKKIAVAVLVAVLPFFSSIVNILSKGIMHDLTVHSFALLMVLAMVLVCEPREGASEYVTAGNELRIPVRSLAPVLVVGVSLFLSVRFSNQILNEEQYRFAATNMYMTRVLDRMEMTEGYEAGVTPVAFVGRPEDDMLVQRPGYPDAWFGQGEDFTLTYSTTYAWYFRDVLGYPISIASASDSSTRLAQTEPVRNMGTFPARDSVQMVGDTLVVKLGEDGK